MASPVVHFEIQSSDAPQLHGFYSDAFGWSIDANNPMNYGIIGPGEGGIGGGIGPTMEGEKNLVTFYIQVDDIAAALEKVGKLGGKTLVGPMEVPDGPTLALFADPQGNTVGLVTGM
jgi:predicted enzyme related to lactoylglutathione lyase